MFFSTICSRDFNGEKIECSNSPSNKYHDSNTFFNLSNTKIIIGISFVVCLAAMSIGKFNLKFISLTYRVI